MIIDMTGTMQEWTFFLTGVLLTLVGIWLTFYIRPGRRLNIFIESRRLIDAFALEQDITIIFKGHHAKSIVKHTLFAWNSGNVSIRGSDVSPDNPLTVEFNQDSILHVESVTKVGQTFKIEGLPQSNLVLIEFNHVDVGQGFSLEIYEITKSIGDNVLPVFNGHILDSKGIKSGIMPQSFSGTLKENRIALIFILAMPFFIVLMIMMIEAYFHFVRGMDSFEPLAGLRYLKSWPLVLALGAALIFPLFESARALRYRVPNFRWEGAP